SLRLAFPAVAAAATLLSSWAAGLGESIVRQGIPEKVPACATCHGPRGEGGRDGAFPRIAGQPAAYLETQLKAFRGGGRSNPQMSRVVGGVGDADIRAVAVFLEREQPPFAVLGGVDPSRLMRGQSLIARGRGEMGIPACTTCHGAALQGVAPALPALAGQSSQ